jgi:hypothetical protein
VTWLLLVGAAVLAAFTALGVEDSRHHRATRPRRKS